MAGKTEAEPTYGDKLADGNGQFALDLYKAISAKQDSNMFFSPGSVSIALAMTYLGARNNTATEMKSTLSWNELDDDNLHSAFQDVINTIGDTSGNYTLDIANRLFGEKKYKFLQEFLDKQKTNYKASLAPMDFANKGDAARKEINEWVASQTNNKIKELLPEGTVDSLTRLILVNAVYFKGNWELKFEEKDTKPGDFYVTPDNKVEVPMMHMKKDFYYGNDYKTKKWQAIELPYKGDKLSMFVVLPAEGETVESIVGMLTQEHFVNPFRAFNMRNAEITLKMPKFKLEQAFDLSETLLKMGMKDLFTEGLADLSDIDGTRNLFVSRVQHQAMIEVNEDGVEAAAATGNEIELYCNKQKVDIFIEKPVLFFIFHKAAKLVLFMGKLTNPLEK